MAEFGIQPQNIVVGAGFRWFARFLDPPPNLQFPEKSFFTPPYCVISIMQTHKKTKLLGHNSIKKSLPPA